MPAPPAENLQGRFSLSRQLGLGISRIVIDPGHGGHDPGAQTRGLNEADLVLDVALRLQQLLLKTPGFEVVLTRDTDVFIPLEERTAIANRAGADLFLSIHANASRNAKAAQASRRTSSTSRRTPTPRPWPHARTRRQGRRCTTCRTS